MRGGNLDGLTVAEYAYIRQSNSNLYLQVNTSSRYFVGDYETTYMCRIFRSAVTVIYLIPEG